MLSQDPDYINFFKALKYAADCGNQWFRSLYKYGVWMPSAAAVELADLAWGLTESWKIGKLWHCS
jgi:hypothetical protein